MPSATSQRFVSDLVKPFRMIGGYLFIGLHTTLTRAWRWADGSKVDYTQWRAGAPDNAGGMQNCAVIDTKLPNGAWDDIQCDATLIAVCKKPAKQ